MFRELYFQLKEHFQKNGIHLQRKQFAEIDRKIYMLDSTVINVCLRVFDWATYANEKGAIKLHTALDFDGCLPSYVCMTKGSQADVRHARYMTIPRHSVIVVDRGYQSFRMFWEWTNRDIYFVTRLKEKIHFRSIEELELLDGADHILKDEVIELQEADTAKDYPGKLRRIVVYDAEQKRTIVILTNNFSWTAAVVAELYKQRWRVEIFFKELKQNLKIKSFIGTNENAMWIQIWTAMITMLLFRLMQETAKYKWHLSNLITFIRLNLFVKMGLRLWLDKPFWAQNEGVRKDEQLHFLEFLRG